MFILVMSIVTLLVLTWVADIPAVSFRHADPCQSDVSLGHNCALPLLMVTLVLAVTLVEDTVPNLTSMVKGAHSLLNYLLDLGPLTLNISRKLGFPQLPFQYVFKRLIV